MRFYSNELNKKGQKQKILTQRKKAQYLESINVQLKLEYFKQQNQHEQLFLFDSIFPDAIKNLQSDYQLCNISQPLYLLSKSYDLENTIFFMSNKTQAGPLSRFYPYLGFDPYFWYQSSRNIDFFSKIKKSEFIQQCSKNNVLVKVEEMDDVDAQKAQIRSSESYQIVKKEAQLDVQNRFQCKEEGKQQRQIVESNASKRNETKNISKNFGKAILSFVKSNSKFSKKLLKRFNIEKQELITYIKKARKNLNSLQDLRQMWGAGDEHDNMKKCLRIASYYFMRKHCLEYIFNSRIRSVQAHTKYRHRLMEGMSKPSQFTNIKVN